MFLEQIIMLSKTKTTLSWSRAAILYDRLQATLAEVEVHSGGGCTVDNRKNTNSLLIAARKYKAKPGGGYPDEGFQVLGVAYKHNRPIWLFAHQPIQNAGSYAGYL